MQLIIIACISCLLGSLYRFFKRDKNTRTKTDYLNDIIISLVAIGIVPLFLVISGSNVLDAVISANSLNTDTLVIMSFFLIASILGDRFISGVSEKVLQTIQEKQKTIEENQKITLEAISIPKNKESLKEILKEKAEILTISNKGEKALDSIISLENNVFSQNQIVTASGLSVIDTVSAINELKDKEVLNEIKFSDGAKYYIIKYPNDEEKTI